MPKSQFTRGQTQILYRFLPDAIFEHDDYGLCKIEEVYLDDAGRINRSALFDTLIDTLQKWTREDFRKKFPDPRNEKDRRRYKIGQPKEIRFNPYPTVLQCDKCRHVVEFERISKAGVSPGHCPRSGCDGRMQQMRFVEIHNCGRLEQMYVPSKGCKEHGRTHIQFHDTGRAPTSRWVCGICHREIQKPRLTPCNCEYSNSDESFGVADKSLRLYPVSEPGVYISHVVAFVNFSEEDEKKLSQVEEGPPMLLARTWGILDRRVLEIIEEQKRWNPGGDELPDYLKDIIKSLEEKNPNDLALLQFKKHQNNPPGQEAINRVKTLLGGVSPPTHPPRRLVEHVALMDNMDLTTIDMLTNRIRDQKSPESALKFEKECKAIISVLGFSEIQVINDFPIALTALGYTRITRDPDRSIFNPFPPDEDGKIPILVIPTETEGLWFHLDPLRVVKWLHGNGILSGDIPQTKLEAWSKLYNEILRFGFSRTEEMNLGASVLECLLHTISHVLMQKIEWSGFASSSIGEYLMPETLSFIIYANRFAEAKIGGLTTLFEQRLPLWLFDAAQSGRECVYDPLCSEDGGNCAGCIHREHNCTFFNRQLSRSCLYGGLVPENEYNSGIQISQGYWSNYMRIASSYEVVC